MRTTLHTDTDVFESNFIFDYNCFLFRVCHCLTRVGSLRLQRWNRNPNLDPTKLSSPCQGTYRRLKTTKSRLKTSRTLAPYTDIFTLIHRTCCILTFLYWSVIHAVYWQFYTDQSYMLCTVSRVMVLIPSLQLDVNNLCEKTLLYEKMSGIWQYRNIIIYYNYKINICCTYTENTTTFISSTDSSTGLLTLTWLCFSLCLVSFDICLKANDCFYLQEVLMWPVQVENYRCVTCITNLGTCVTNLGTCITNLGTCITNLALNDFI